MINFCAHCGYKLEVETVKACDEKMSIEMGEFCDSNDRYPVKQAIDLFPCPKCDKTTADFDWTVEEIKAEINDPDFWSN